MTNYIDLQYAIQLSQRYERVSIKSRNPLKINLRCPICGDSKKSRVKARGWINENTKTQKIYYGCFNCGASLPFYLFLKQQDPALYKEYIVERFVSDKETNPKENFQKTKTKIKTKKLQQNVLKDVKKLSQLKADHPAKQYVDNRRIPSQQHYRIYYSPAFMKWINSVEPNTFKNITKDEPRLLFPLRDTHKQVFGVSARSFDPNAKLRYITIMFDKEKPKIFGEDVVDFSKTYFVVEGAVDSLFLSNSLAMVGADGNINNLKNKENAILIYDKEPRNLEIVKAMERVVKKDCKVCFLPHTLPGKDINEMVLNGVTNLEQIILNNTYSGLEAELQLSKWKNVA